MPGERIVFTVTVMDKIPTIPAVSSVPRKNWVPQDRCRDASHGAVPKITRGAALTPVTLPRCSRRSQGWASGFPRPEVGCLASRVPGRRLDVWLPRKERVALTTIVVKRESRFFLPNSRSRWRAAEL